MIEGIENQIMYSTLQIEATHHKQPSSFGTGFLFMFDNNFPCLITNKHVVESFEKVYVRFTQADENQNPLLGQFIECDITNCLTYAIPHPDTEVDLVAIPLKPILCVVEETKQKAFMYFYSFDIIPSSDDWKWICPGKDVLMIGYPLGIIDKKNNLPIVRKGAIATIPTVDFDTDHGFLLDISCNKGSSGSPIIAIRYGYQVDLETGKIDELKDFRLIGIQCKGYDSHKPITITVKGKPVDQNIEIVQTTNLAIVAPSTDLIRLNEIIVERFFRNQQHSQP